ncbi:MAG: hypothetical protein ACK4NC_04115 [Candidatus Gracilibacteria bacterium]
MTETSTPTSAPRERSNAYPAITLEEAIEHSKKLLLAYPKSNFDRQTAALALGYDNLNGTSTPRIAALVHYGLIERTGTVCKNSDIAQRIHNFTSNEEKEEAIIEAALNPKIFKALIEEYEGKALPPTLNNILVRSHGINQKVSEKVVRIFKNTMEYAKIYANGIINTQELKKDLPKAFNDNQITTIPTNPSPSQITPVKAKISTEQNDMISIKLPSGAVLYYPQHLAYLLQTDTDFGKTLTQLEHIISKALNNEVN